MTTDLQIDFVSDVACPWCAVGLNSLETALQRLAPDVKAALRCQPFELNPDMAAEGADAGEYLKAKYGMGDEQLARNREVIRERGAAVGFSFGDRARVWNTFDAHRLLHGEGRNPGAQDVLLDLAGRAGLDEAAAAEVLKSGRYGTEVRAAELEWQQAGISSVPAVVINGKHLISGGQPPEVFEQALRQIASGQA